MLLIQIIDLYSLIVLVSVVMSWVRLPATNPVNQLVEALTEPVLTPIRKALPPTRGLDFSPMFLLVGLRLLRGLLF